MHIRSLPRHAITLAALVLIAGAAIAQPGATPEPKRDDAPRQPGGERRGGPGERGPRGQGEGRAPSLEGAMKAVNRSVRALKDQISDASKKDENLQLINDMQRAAITAKGAKFELHGDAKHTPEQLAALAKSFRTQMIALAKEMLALEELVLDGKTADAKAKLDAIIAMRDKAHKEFGVKDD